MKTSFKALVLKYRPLIERRRRGDWLTVPQKRQYSRPICRVCGNQIGSDGCKNYRPA